MNFFYLILFSAIFISNYAQLKPLDIQKMCVAEHVSSVRNICVVGGVIVVQADGSIYGLDAYSGNQLWSNNFPMGYGIYNYGNKVVVESPDPNPIWDEKSKSYSKNDVWITTIDPKSGVKLDSIKVNFNVVTFSNTQFESSTIALISQKSIYKAAVVDKISGKEKFVLQTETSGSTSSLPFSIATSPNDKFVAVGTANGSKGFYLYDKNTGKQLLNIPGKGDVISVQFSSDSKYCFYYHNKALKIINTATLKLEKEVSIGGEGSCFVTLHSNNEIVALSSNSGSLPMVFVNWKTGELHTSQLKTAGGQPYYLANGDLILPTGLGVQCFVNPTKLPYLARVKFNTTAPTTVIENTTPTTTNNSTTLNSSSQSNQSFKAGERAMILYKADGKYYSGTILEVSGDNYSIIFDDATRASVKGTELKVLPGLKVGEKIQARRSDAKFYYGIVKVINGSAVKIEFANGTEWISIRDVMQVQ